MKIKSSLKCKPGTDEKIIKRKGRLYRISKTNPNRKARQR